VACSVVYIRSNFGWLPENIKRLETQGRLLQESMEIMKNASEKLSVGTKLQAVLERTMDVLHLAVSVKYLMETM
jgi:hypothetical protein